MQMSPRGPGAPPRRSRMRGLSMLELLIGAALGLLVVAAAGTIAVGSVTSTRRQLVEARLEQDVRSAVEVIEREVRRSGYWANALYEGRKPTAAATAVVNNPHASLVLTGSSQLDYTYSSKVLDNQATSDELFSVRLNSDTQGLEVRRDAQGAWQPLTDADSLKVEAFSVALDSQRSRSTPATTSCSCTCSVTTPAPVCRGVSVRVYTIALTGASRSDATLKRTLSSTVRVRNDQIMANICAPCATP
ncbi:MAG: hypothetical protein PHI55_04230 [Burkholderiaceae bacterium]|nr:hypothetical protein [Burkholderiaceae bacterium]